MMQAGMVRGFGVSGVRALVGCAVVLGSGLVGSGVAVAARLQDVPVANAEVPTLRVETNLVQIPVLVLDQFKEKVSAPIAADRFAIRVGEGGWVRPRYVRREGQDAIDLAVVVDPRGAVGHMLPELSEAMGRLGGSLSSRDRVSIYVMGCSGVHVARHVPLGAADADASTSLRAAEDDTVLRGAMEAALKAGVEEGGAKCKMETKLWDTLAYVARGMGDEPGRRTIVAITAGQDEGSRHTAEEAGSAARLEGVTVFVVNPGSAVPSWAKTGEDPLSLMSESTGGMLLNLGAQRMDKELARVVGMLRERYIVEFPRPLVEKAGMVHIEVRVNGTRYFVRTASKSVPLPEVGKAGGGSAAAAVVGAPVQVAGQEAVASSRSEEDSAAHAPVAVAVAPVAVAPVAAARPEGDAGPVVSTAEADLATPTLHVTSKLTVENVTVTDSRRVAVHGLKKAEFELREDGKVQAIRNFEEFDGGRGSVGGSAAPAMAAGTYTNAAAAVPVGTTVNVLVMDSVTTGLTRGLAMAPENFGYARQQAMNYLKNLPAGTEVSILHLGKGVRVVQELTEDKELLLGAMKSIQYRPVLGTYAIQGGACNAANVQSEYVVEDLDEIAAYLAGIKGRKNVIWFTPGTPWLTDYAQFSGASCLRDYTRGLDKAYALLNAAQVVLNPIDPRGLVGEESFSAAKRGRTVMGAFGGGLMVDESSLGDLAEATGGTAYFSRNDVDRAVGEAVAAGSDYYSLAYVPPVTKYDGKFHRISVKVSRGDLVLKYRPGYVSVNPAQVAAVSGGKSAGGGASGGDSFLGTMGHGTVNATGMRFEVRVAAAGGVRKAGGAGVIGTVSKEAAGKRLVRYEFVYGFTGDEITLEDGADGSKHGSVEFVLAAYDGDGRLLNTVGQTGKFTVKAENVAGFLGRKIEMPVEFDVPAGNVFVRAGVKDVASDKVGTVEIAESVARK
ncbi:MAG TPA: VWA domain-containing protein [Acidobacteriaceae bacterium]|nr:VWA domain-containing protein [Acidobacteriaceae bacterium]